MKLVEKAQAKIEELKQKYNGLDRRKKCILVGIGCLLCCVIMYVWFGIKTDKGTRPKQRGGAPLVAVYKADRRDVDREHCLDRSADHSSDSFCRTSYGGEPS